MDYYTKRKLDQIEPMKQLYPLAWRDRKHCEICPEMHALAKMAEMAINRQTINKNSNEMAKGPFAKWRFWRKWQKWQLIAKIAKLYNKQKFK